MNAAHFLGLPFIPLALSHQAEFEAFFRKFPQKLAWYTFASLISWSEVYSYTWTALGKDCILLSACIGNDGQRHLLQPLGIFSPDHEQKVLQGIKTSGSPTRIFGVSGEFTALHPQFCSHFEDQNDWKKANYVYRSQDLAALKGRRYEKKRNLISQAEHLYKWNLQPLTEACKPYCPKILLDVGAKTSSEMTTELEQELKALEFILKHFSLLKLKGFLISIEGHPTAFSIYERLNQNTALVHFEKAERKFKGLYQLINRETAKAILQEGFEYINREEDLGIEGLRKAKKSYFPIELVASHQLKYKA